MAVAEVQAQGRGRFDRTWQADPGRALLVSAGFRPRTLAPLSAWRLPAIASMAMLDAATSLLGPTADRLALKWPNDIVAVHRGRLLKVGGVLAEGSPEADRMATTIVGLGINVDWPAADFPVELATSMWSLSESSGGRRVDRDALLRGWLLRLEPLYASLLEGHFDSQRWAEAQITTGTRVTVDTGSETVEGTAVGVDHRSGSLIVRIGRGIPLRRVAFGEVSRCEVGDAA